MGTHHTYTYRSEEMASLYCIPPSKFGLDLPLTVPDCLGPNPGQHLSPLELGSLTPKIIFLQLNENAEASPIRRPSPWCVTSRAEKDLNQDFPPDS